jgi:hypothetical protein
VLWITSLFRLLVQVIVTTLWSACSFGHKLSSFAAIKRVIDRREELQSLITALSCQTRSSPSRPAAILPGSEQHPDTPLELDVHTPFSVDAATDHRPADSAGHPQADGAMYCEVDVIREAVLYETEAVSRSVVYE